MLKIVQRCRDSRLDSRVKHARKLKSYANCCTTGQKSQAGQAISSRFELATQSSHEAKKPSRQTTLFGKNWLFAFLSHPTIYRPLYTQNIESFQREFWGRNPREKQDWFIPNLHIKTLQIPLLSSSPLLHPWEVHYQNLFSSYPHLWEGHLVFGKQLGRDQFHIGWCYGL